VLRKLSFKTTGIRFILLIIVKSLYLISNNSNITDIMITSIIDVIKKDVWELISLTSYIIFDQILLKIPCVASSKNKLYIVLGILG
jgi:hypothetical protein